MSTRSEVYIQREDGSLHGCYMHFDGYPSCRGSQCLAHAEAGTLEDFIRENCENDCDEDGYDYVWASEEEMAKDVSQSDREWVYVLLNNGAWSVWEQTYSDGKFGFKHHMDLWKLVASERKISIAEIRKKISAKAKIYRREYGKDTERPYAVHITKITFNNDIPVVKESTVPMTSFDEMVIYFGEIQNFMKSQGLQLVIKDKTQIIAKCGKNVIVVTKI